MKRRFRKEFNEKIAYVPLEPPSLNLSNCQSWSPDGGGTISNKQSRNKCMERDKNYQKDKICVVKKRRGKCSNIFHWLVKGESL